MTASRILVVDDEADIRGLLKEILSEEGYEVEVAADATQARSSRVAQVPRPRAARYLDAGHGRHHPAARMVGDRRLRLPGGHDVRPRHGRDRRRGHAPRRLRFRREAAVADQAAAHGGAGARRGAPQAAVGARPRVGARRAHRQEQGHPGAARAGSARRLQLISGAAARRIGIRARGLRALPALAERARIEAVFHGGGRELGRRTRPRPCSAASATAASSRAPSIKRPAARCTSTGSRI